jgi:N-acetylglutamate synthase/N-acetylornithine aminotransferase
MVVKGDHTEDSCRDLARSIVNGPLLKSAVAGNDPNVGRLVGK